MQRSTILALAFLSFAALLPAACTQNFGLFEPSGGVGGASSASSGSASSGSTSTSSTGGAGGCKADPDCSDSNPCTTDTCNKATGKCSHAKVPDGPLSGVMPGSMNCMTPGCVMGAQAMVPADMNVPPNTSCATFKCSMGNLQTNNLPPTTSCGMAPEHCDGMGACVGCKMDSDCPGVGDCQQQHCDTGMMKCSPTNKASGTPCSSNGGKVCDDQGACVHCVQDGDCNGPPEICVSKTCMSSCGDGKKDGNETDVDCGGACPRCADGKTCNDDADCVSQVCTNNKCAMPSCTDGVQNGTETDTDCGGNACPKCGTGKMCGNNGDCQSDVCNGGVCIDQCSDGVKDGMETDVDCGGGTCGKCANGKMCSAGSDCTSGDCYHTGGGAGQKTCHANLCNDGVKDGNETGVDCGGPCAAKCADGVGCLGDADCMNGFCNLMTKQCATPTCSDTLKNGNETDVDCGGAGFMGAGACPKCANGKVCAADGDCASGTCIGQLCYPSSCADGIKNGAETDVDCGGGACPKCANGLHCMAGSDCVSGNCNGGSMKCM